MQTADTLGEGRIQVALEPGVWGVTSLAEDVEGGAITHLDLAVRYGVSDTVDIGARVGSSLIEVQSKFLLTDVEDPAKAISLAPALSGILAGGGDAAGGYTTVTLPVLIGFKTSGGSELVLGPRLTDTFFFSAGEGGGVANILSAGASIGYAARIGKGFRLMPEVAVLVPLVGTLASASDSDVTAGFSGGIFQIKLGFLFGEGRPIAASAGTGAAPSP